MIVSKFNTIDVMMRNSEIFPANEIDELIEYIINKFAHEKLTCEKAKVVLEKTQELIGDFSQVISIDP